MTYILTFVSSDLPLTPGPLALVEDVLARQAIGPAGPPSWIEPHKAAELPIVQKPDHAQMVLLRAALAADRVDVFVNHAEGRRKKLLLADMDSTIITTETLDELAGYVGLKDKIAALTERAMRGEIDFEATLRERVMMIKGLSVDKLAAARDAIVFSPGAKTLVATMRAQGALCVLVSGGFTEFTSWVAQRGGFQHDHANRFEIRDNALTGKIIDPVLDKQAKLAFLHHYVEKTGIDLAQSMTIGDGSNDLPMLDAAGFGVGYRPKPMLLEALDNCIIHGDLTAALYAQGYRREEFVTKV